MSWGAWDVIWQARWFDDTEFAEGAANPVITDTDGLILRGGPVGQDPDDVFEDGEFTEFAFQNETRVAAEFRPVRLVTEAEGQVQHDISATYNRDNFSLTAGINNVADEEPPLIGWNAGPNRNNAVTLARYDQIGRSYFVRLTVAF